MFPPDVKPALPAINGSSVSRSAILPAMLINTAKMIMTLSVAKITSALFARALQTASWAVRLINTAIKDNALLNANAKRIPIPTTSNAMQALDTSARCIYVKTQSMITFTTEKKQRIRVLQKNGNHIGVVLLHDVYKGFRAKSM